LHAGRRRLSKLALLHLTFTNCIQGVPKTHHRNFLIYIFTTVGFYKSKTLAGLLD